MSALVVGFGNPLCGDDGAGPLAVHLLRERGRCRSARLLSLHELGPELAEALAQASCAVFVDARADAPPGEVELREIDPDERAPVGLTHGLEPAGLLRAARGLYGRAPPAWAATIGAERLDPGAPLSAAVARGLPLLCEAVEERLDRGAS